VTGNKIAEATVLDVGHGNSTVIRDGNGATLVVDAAPGLTLPDELHRTATQRIDNLVLSHADQDHIGGAAALLSGPLDIGTLWINTDAMKNTATYADLCQLAWERNLGRGMSVNTQLDSTVGSALKMSDVYVDVVHPTLRETMTGPRPQDHRQGPVTANQMSAVLRVRTAAGTAHLLLPGDLDRHGLDDLLARGIDLRSRVLVYPHHGGHSGDDDFDFARRLILAVQPELVIFSLGRARHRNPKPEIIAAILQVAPEARIACTQLSVRCAASTTHPATHLLDRPAAGMSTTSCCAGTIAVPLNDSAPATPAADEHRRFIATFVPTAMCISEAVPST
jgi:beta-lactamase superfamily II metal-dependent hydrolase